jgi:hypothetical protein
MLSRVHYRPLCAIAWNLARKTTGHVDEHVEHVWQSEHVQHA